MTLFSSSKRILAEQIAALGFANPFGTERRDIENRLLAQAPEGLKTPGNRSAFLQWNDQNRKALRAVARPVIYEAREKLAAGHDGTEAELKIYDDLVLFQLYYRYSGQFEAVINEVLAGHQTQDLTYTLYEAFCADAAFFLGVTPRGPKLIDELPHIFALFFQLTRAFLYIFHFLVGSSAATNKLRINIWESIFTHDMRRYRRKLYDKMGEVPTLITGPSGTGKELVARAIGLSRYIPFDPAKRRFVRYFDEGFYPLNLSALSETVMESELFGHRKGSFTGASTDRQGFFEKAGDLGTVFLDEIGEVNEAIQVKLLRVLQTRQFQRLGDTEERCFQGKIIAATNRDLALEMHEGRFRKDFFYRLCADQLTTPSLSAQLSGSAGILEELVDFVATRVAGPDEGPALACESMEWMRKNLPSDYPWPGNFRELEQCVRNIMIRRDYNPPQAHRLAPSDQLGTLLANLELSADDLLSQYVTHIYAREGSYEAAARVLDMDRRTVKARTDEKLLQKIRS
ncbi:MAG: sigma 54-interacting transcriptional regulator [Myxococcota bacterium]|nr:sigma 54-interacting transcriptional regulator [Myxococcota bacterium]